MTNSEDMRKGKTNNFYNVIVKNKSIEIAKALFENENIPSRLLTFQTQ